MGEQVSAAIKATFLDGLDIDERARGDALYAIRNMTEEYTAREVRAMEFALLQPGNAPIFEAVTREKLRIIKETYLWDPAYGIGGAWLGKTLRDQRIHGDRPKVNLAHLVVNETRLRYKGQEYTFAGNHAGAAILVSDEGEFVSADPSLLDEASRAIGPVAYPEFLRGYEQGWIKGRETTEIGTEKLGKVPSDYSRGFVAGHRDGLVNNYRATSHAPYNETIREGEFRIQERFQAMKKAILEGLLKPGTPLTVETPAGTCPIRKCEFVDRIELTPGRLFIQTGGYDRIWLRRQLTAWLENMPGTLLRHFTLLNNPHGVDTREEVGDFDTYTLNF